MRPGSPMHPRCNFSGERFRCAVLTGRDSKAGRHAIYCSLSQCVSNEPQKWGSEFLTKRINHFLSIFMHSMDNITLITNTEMGLKEWTVNNGLFVIAKYKDSKYEVRFGTSRHPSFDTIEDAINYVKEKQA